MKKILITGASEGIGFETAKQLAQEGNQITMVARNPDKLEKAVKSLAGTGHSVISADLSKKDDVHVIIDHMVQNHYDVLINNAGVGMYGRFDEMPLEQQANMMRLNMFGPTPLCLAYLKNGKRGDAIVNVASTLGITSFPGTAVYAATKAYIVNLSEALWYENKKKGIYVMAFCPGVTDTNFHSTAGESQDKFPKFIIQTPAQVAKELIRALHKRSKPVVVSGAVNRSMLFFQRFMSRKMIVNMMGGFSPVKN